MKLELYFMNQHSLIITLETLTQNVHDCIDRLKETKENEVPGIEIALLENKLINLYDQVQNLKKYRKPTQEALNTDIEEIKQIQKTVEKNIIEFDLNDDQVEEDTSYNSEIEQLITEHELELETIENHEIEEDKAEVEEKVVEEKAIEEETVKPSINANENTVSETTKEDPVLEEKVATTIHEVETERESDEESKLKVHFTIDESTEEVSNADDKQEIIIEEKTPTSKKESAVETPNNEALKNTSETESPKVKTSLNDRLAKNKTEKLTLNERLAANKEKQQELSKKLSANKPISDIKKAIPLNQQLLLMRQLFGGDKKSYKLTIDFVNKCKTYSEARSFMQQEVLERHKIDVENELYQDLLMIVKRKFM